MQSPEDAVFDFAHQFLRDRDDGVVRTLGEYLARFPGHEAVVTAEYERLRGNEPSAASGEARAEVIAGATIGSYRLLHELGRGGQAAVWLAHDLRIDRRVALKVLPFESVLRAESKRERFRREAKVLGQLELPGICAVLDADIDGHRPWIAMRYVEGDNLLATTRAWCAPRPVPDVATMLRIVALIERAARALHGAHEAGVVHRDVKPSNIVIESDDRPVLVDFGLARLEDSDDATLTRVGDVPGTLAYMAPELLLGSAPADRRTDVWSLGVTLFECLTGRRPFVAETREGLWRAIAEDTPTDPRRWNTAIPKDLAVVVLTALGKRPEDRYATALAFAEDLRRVRSWEPIVAQPVGVARRLRLWVHRHPVATGGLAALTAMAVLSTLFALQAQRGEFSASRTLAAFDEADPVVALQHMVDAAETMRTTRTDGILWHGLDLCDKAYSLTRYIPNGIAVDQPGWNSRSLMGSQVVDPRGERMAFLTPEGTVEVFRIRDGEQLHVFRAHASGATGCRDAPIAFSPDGAALVTGGIDGMVRRWSTRDWSEIEAVALTPDAVPPEAVCAIGFTSDGASMIAGGAAGGVLVHELATGISRRTRIGDELVARVITPRSTHRILALLDLPIAMAASKLACLDTDSGSILWKRAREKELVVSADWHPSGNWIAVGTTNAELLVLDATTGETAWHAELAPEEPNVRWCAFDPTGQSLMAGAPPGTHVFRWDGNSAVLHATVSHPHRRATVAAALSPDGDLLASLARDGSMSFVDTRTWRSLRTFETDGMATNLQCVHWAAAAQRIVAGRNYVVDSWFAPPREGVQTLFVHTGAVRSVAVHPNGESLLSAGEDGRVCRTDLRTGGSVVRTCARPPVAARFSPSGSRYLVCDGATVAVFATVNGEPLRTVDATRAMFVDDEHVLVVRDRDVVRLEVSTGVERGLYRHVGAVRAAVVDTVNEQLFTAGADRFVRGASLDGEQTVASIELGGAARFEHGSPFDVIGGMGVAPHAGLLLIPRVNLSLFFEPITKAARERWHHGREFPFDRFGGLVAVHPDETVAVLSDASFGRITWVDLRTLDPADRVQSDQHTQTVTAISFSRSGALCLTASLDGTVEIWDSATRTIRSTLRLDGTTIHDACFMPDERSFVTGDGRGQIRIWPIAPLPVATEYLRSLARVRRR